MFRNHAALKSFLDVLVLSPIWQGFDMVDMSVYGTTQLLRAPCATKAPPFDNKSCLFDLNVVNNVLLPVESTTGAQLMPMFSAQRPYLYMTVHQWNLYLVTSFNDGAQALSLPQSTPSSRLSSLNLSVCCNVVLCYVAHMCP